MHFLSGILFLVVTILLVAVYLIVSYLIIVGVQRLIYKFRLGVITDNEPVKMKLWPAFSKKAYFKIILLTAVILIGVYSKQRVEWMGKDNAHDTAKEYWASGQVLASIRFALVRVLHPENPILWPYNRLQKVIYEKGIQYLSKDDGEIGIWTDAWFLYPYNLRGLLPKVSVKTPYRRHLIDPVFKTDKKFPQIISLLDRCWFALETMATKPYADRQMKFQHYYRNFPGLAMYYIVYDGFYVGKYTGSAKYLLRNQKYTSRLEQLLKWLEDLKAHWEADRFYQTIWEKYPKVGAIRQIVHQAILLDLLSVLAYRKEFRCDHPWVAKLYQSYLDIMSDDYSNNILLRLKEVNTKEASFLYKQNVYSLTGEVGQYVLKHFCHHDLPKEKLLLISKRDYKSRWSIHAIKSKEQIKLIKEIDNE